MSMKVESNIGIQSGLPSNKMLTVAALNLSECFKKDRWNKLAENEYMTRHKMTSDIKSSSPAIQ